MNREEIIKMARESGGVTGGHDTALLSLLEIERFAALVAAAEREACAKACDATAMAHSMAFLNRESANAKGARNCATSIRARGTP